MKRIAEQVKQFFVAAEQIGLKDTAHSRLAVILIDNVLELKIHKICEYIFAEDGMWGASSRKYSENERKKVLGQHFDEKVNFLRRINYLNSDEADFILICHKYRNELYHRGILKEEIISHIANAYYFFACVFYKRNRPRSYCSGGGGSASAEKMLLVLIKKKEHLNLLNGDWDSIWNVVETRVVSLEPELGQVLSAHLIARLQAVDELIDYVRAGGYQSFDTPEDYVKHTQAWRFLWEDEGKKYIKENMPAGEYSVQNYIDFLQQNWRPKYKYKDIARWEKRAKELNNEKSKFILLKKFDNILMEFESFEEMIMNDVEVFDNWVNEQVDIMRGK
jgi:hypothetical protein